MHRSELGSIGNPAVMRLDLKTQKPATGTGYYYIDPNRTGSVRVHCEMTLEGGGWTLVGKFNLNVTGPVINGVTSRANPDVNLGYLGADDNDGVFTAGHLSVERTGAVVNAADRKMMNLVQQHSTQKHKYCWSHYAAGPDANWSYVSGRSQSPGVGSCGLLGWGHGRSCGATSMSCSSQDAHDTMDAHWMHANGLNQGTLSGTVQTYCGGNSTRGLGQSASPTGDRRGTCYLYAR